MDNTVGSQQRDVIVGTLLGDSFLERNGRFVRLVADHSMKQKEYVEWKATVLTQFSSSITCKIRSDDRTGNNYEHCILRTRTSSRLEEYVPLFYVGKKKVVPRNLPALMNPQVLAVWIMDDGYRRNDCNAMRLNTQCYAYAEQLLIQEALAGLGLVTSIHKQKEQFVQYVPSGSMRRLRALVRPFIIPSMAYKIA